MDNQSKNNLDVNSILSDLGYKSPKSTSTPAPQNNAIPTQPRPVSSQPVQRPVTPQQRPVTQPSQRPAVPAQRPAAPTTARPAAPIQRPTQPQPQQRPTPPVQRPMATTPQRPTVPTQQPAVPQQRPVPTQPIQRPSVPAQRPVTPTTARPVAPAGAKPIPPTPARPSIPQQPKPTVPQPTNRPMAPTGARPVTPAQKPAMPQSPQAAPHPTTPVGTRPVAPTNAPATPVQKPTTPTMPPRQGMPVQPRPTTTATPRPGIPLPPKPGVQAAAPRPAVSTQRPTAPAQPRVPQVPTATTPVVPVVMPTLGGKPPVKEEKFTFPNLPDVPKTTTETPVLTPDAKPAETLEQVLGIDKENEKPDKKTAKLEKKAAKLEKKASKKEKKKGFVERFIIQRGDSIGTIFIKLGCFVCVLLLAGSLCVIVNDFIIEPSLNSQIASEVESLLTPDLNEAEQNYDGYPSGILNEYRKIYFANHDTIGWIKYPHAGSEINYPVVQTDNNDDYLTKDFYGKENKNGTIFLDYRCRNTDTREGHHINILYGHNMRSGQMFAGLNRLLSGVSYARNAPLVEFNTLFEKSKYKVFAVMSNDSKEAGAFQPLVPYIETDEDFLTYIRELRLRSWYNYSSIEVNATDDILILYTCSNTYQTTMGKSGRTIVACRKIRPGESEEVDTSTITENRDKLMPKVWYVNKKLDLPDYYTQQQAG